MSDEITITLPVSGKEVVIRNYTTRADDKAAEEVLYREVTTSSGKDGKSKIVFPIANIMDSTAVYVRRLVKSIGGSDGSIVQELEALRTDDYLAIEKAVDKVVEEHSPKAKTA